MSKGKDKGGKEKKKIGGEKTKPKALSEYQQSKSPHIVTSIVESLKDKKK